MLRKLAPSILDVDFTCLERELKKIESGGADLLHLDIMDGNFVPNISFGPRMVESIKSITSLPLEVHLMIEKPENHIKSFIDAGGDIVIVHYETSKHLDRLIQTINKAGVESGIALNPATPLSVIEYLMMIGKIEKARKIIDTQKKSISLAVDGGINLDNISKVIKAGAEIIVAGQIISKSANPEETIKKIKNILN